MLTRALIVVLALVVTYEPAASAAEAAASERLELQVAPGCQRVDAAQLSRLLNIEAERDARTQGARISVTCEDGVASLRVARAGPPALERARSFGESDVAGEVGARVLSLAVVELLNDGGPSQEPATSTEPASEAEPVRQQISSSSPTVRLMLSGSASSFSFEQALVGGGFSVDFLRLSRLGLRLELGLALGKRRYDLGTAHLQLTSMSVQAGYLALHDSWTARAMLGYRFGSARISGEAEGSGTREGTVSGVCGGPLLAAGLGLRSSNFVAELAVEAGLVSFPLEGQVEGESPIALDGYWVGLSVNLGTLL